MSEQGEIYIIDDQRSVRVMLRSILEDAGYSICGEAEDAETALDDIQKLNPDLLLVDIQLKTSFSGIDLMQRVNQKNYRPSIFISSNTEAKTVDEVKQVDPMGFIPKPFTEHEVLLAVELALHKSTQNSGSNERGALPAIPGGLIALIGEGGDVNGSGEQIELLNNASEDSNSAISTLLNFLDLSEEQKAKLPKLARSGSYLKMKAPITAGDHIWDWQFLGLEPDSSAKILVLGRDTGLPRSEVQKGAITKLSLEEGKHTLLDLLRESEITIQDSAREVATWLPHLSGIVSSKEEQQLLDKLYESKQIMDQFSLDLNKVNEVFRRQFEAGSDGWDIRLLIQDIVQSVRPRCEKKGAELQVEIKENVSKRLNGDQTLFKEFLNRLIDHAIGRVQKNRIEILVHAGETNTTDQLIQVSISYPGSDLVETQNGKSNGRSENDPEDRTKLDPINDDIGTLADQLNAKVSFDSRPEQGTKLSISVWMPMAKSGSSS